AERPTRNTIRAATTERPAIGIRRAIATTSPATTPYPRPIAPPTAAIVPTHESVASGLPTAVPESAWASTTLPSAANPARTAPRSATKTATRKTSAITRLLATLFVDGPEQEDAHRQEQQSDAERGARTGGEVERADAIHDHAGDRRRDRARARRHHVRDPHEATARDLRNDVGHQRPVHCEEAAAADRQHGDERRRQDWRRRQHDAEQSDAGDRRGRIDDVLAADPVGQSRRGIRRRDVADSDNDAGRAVPERRLLIVQPQGGLEGEVLELQESGEREQQEQPRSYQPHEVA